MATDRKPQALAWLQSIYSQLSVPNGSFSAFIGSLRLNNYGEYISESDFQEWLQSVGSNVNDSATIAANVKNAIVNKYKPYPNQYPTRKTIDSAFINPANATYTYFDAVKVASMDIIKVGKIAADATGKLVYSVTQATTSVVAAGNEFLKYAKYLAIPAVLLIGYIMWSKRDAIADEAVERGKKLADSATGVAGKLAKKGLKKIGVE